MTSMSGGASRSWEHDRDTLHRTDRTLDDIRAFLDGNVAADITPHDRKAAYAFVDGRWSGSATTSACRGPGRARSGGTSPRSPATRFPADRADRAAAPHGPDPRPPAASPVAALRHGLHHRRRDTAGRGGRGARPALGTGDEEDPVAHVPCLRRQALRAPGGDFERPHLQPACSPGGSTPCTAATATAEGGLRDQHGRRSDAVPATCGGSPDHRALHGSRARGARWRDASGSRRQRVGVHQPPGRRLHAATFETPSDNARSSPRPHSHIPERLAPQTNVRDFSPVQRTWYRVDEGTVTSPQEVPLVMTRTKSRIAARGRCLSEDRHHLRAA